MIKARIECVLSIPGERRGKKAFGEVYAVSLKRTLVSIQPNGNCGLPILFQDGVKRHANADSLEEPTSLECSFCGANTTSVLGALA